MWEEFFFDSDITEGPTLLAKADRLKDVDLANTIAISAELDPSAPVPYAEFVRGDTVSFQAAGYIDKQNRRITDITLSATTNDGGELDWVPSITASKLFMGAHAKSEALISLLQEYKRPEEAGDGSAAAAAAAAGVSTGDPPGAFIHLSRNATQSIAVNGEPISWDVFGATAAGFTETLPTTTVTIKEAGYYNIAVQAGWSTWANAGTLSVVRIRKGASVTVWPPADDPGLWTATNGKLFEGTAHAIECLEGDTLQVDIDADDTSAQTLLGATLAVYLVDRAEVEPTYSALVLADGPIAYWRLGEKSGTNAVDQLGSFDGTYTNTPTLGVAPLMVDRSGDSAVDFVAASNEHVLGADWAAMDFATGSFSIEAWFNADVLTGTTQIIIEKQVSSGVGWELGVVTAGVFFASDLGSVVQSGTLTVGRDYHVVVTSDQTTTILYLNGVQVDSNGGGLTITANTEVVSIAFDTSAVGFAFDGTIDEVATYARVLTAAEVAEHYRVGTRDA